MTTVGEARSRYAQHTEPRPPRFTNPQAYTAWAARADKQAANRARFAAYLESEIAYAELMV